MELASRNAGHCVGSESLPGETSDHHVLDFAQAAQSELLACDRHLRLGDVTICRCAYRPNSGRIIATAQLVVALHFGEPFELVWRNGSGEHRRAIAAGSINISPPEMPIYLKWDDATPQMHVVAIQQPFIKRILVSAGIGSAATLSATFGILDTVVRQLIEACESEVTTQGASGRLYAEGLAMALVTHVYRTHGDAAATTLSKGGLSARDERTVIAYIDAHLKDDIGLDDLAATIGLSAHYFIEAFRQTVGMPPYRYLLNKRVERAKALLLENRMSTAEIATAVGFSSQAQLTVNFRRLVGTTPGRFRREGQA